MCFRRGSVSSLYSWHLQIIYSLTDLFMLMHLHVHCISHVIKLKIKIISDSGLLKMTGHRHQNLKGMWYLTPQLAQSPKWTFEFTGLNQFPAFISSPGPLVAITWRPSSVNFSHFKLLLRNHWADWNQT